MSYSEDFRQQVLSHIDTGATIEEVSKLFSVGTSSIKRWKRNRKETGTVMGPGRPKGPYKIDNDKLKQYLEKHPDAFLDEIAAHFSVTTPAVFVALKRLNITRKKRRRFTKKDARQSVQNT
jgi:transposase